MNPSISGWIKKYFLESNEYGIFTSNDYTDITHKIREIGFSFGTVDTLCLPEIYHNFNYTQEELSKICFLQLLEKCFFIKHPDSSQENFIETVIAFYQSLLPNQKSSFLPSFLEEKNIFIRLEKTLSYRWKDHFFSQSKDNDMVLNTILLSLDILTFEAYLNTNIQPENYNLYLTESLIEIIIAIREQAHQQTNDDYELVKFLKQNSSDAATDDYYNFNSVLEKNLTADFIVCNSWNNENKEIVLPDFSIFPLSKLKIDKEILERSQRDFLIFVAKQDFDYHYFRSSSLLNNTVQNSVSRVELLLTRNKNRLIKEIQKNTQLMGLLMDSTFRNLNDDEKKIVKTQTIEVIKTIPSLALFLLPGGSILLPILLKLIPSLLPSSFNENSNNH